MDRIMRQKAEDYLTELCVKIKDRSVGSGGNIEATLFFEKTVAELGWDTEKTELNAVDWENGGCELIADGSRFETFVGPYSNGCNVDAILETAADIEELEKVNAEGKILLLYGEIAKEQLMPKSFVFYNPPEHQKIISLLEQKGIKAIISATGRNAALAGGVYPFPLIEDGDFDIPSVYMTEEEGEKLLKYKGNVITLNSYSQRIKSRCYNVTARKGKNNSERIVITAHIDAKKGSPGAIDNATGVVILMLLAEKLKNYHGKYSIELIPFNGEDYYAVPGQMEFLEKNKNKFGDILLNINIDGAGYKIGESAFSFYGVPDEMKQRIMGLINSGAGILEGAQWPQGDHSMFVQQNRPAIAVTSKWFSDNVNCQTITHTPKDNFNIVDCRRLTELSFTISEIVEKIL